MHLKLKLGFLNHFTLNAVFVFFYNIILSYMVLLVHEKTNRKGMQKKISIAIYPTSKKANLLVG